MASSGAGGAELGVQDYIIVTLKALEHRHGVVGVDVEVVVGKLARLSALVVV